MRSKEEMLITMEYSDKILQLIDEQIENEVSRGDLQGIVEAIVMGVQRESIKDLKEKIETIRDRVEGDNNTWEQLNDLIK